MRKGWIAAAAVCGLAWMLTAQPDLWHLRNLGKAFYENPATQKQAVDVLRRALDMAPNSARERLNYALALLRAGDMAAGVTELEKVRKADPKLPHTWFNLGITFKKQGDFDRALAEFQQMVRLDPNEPVAHYQLGVLHKAKGDTRAAIREFEIARKLSPRLAAPHFQLFNSYRAENRAQDAAAELRIFQELKKEQEDAAVKEDMDWCAYAELYDPIDARPPAPPAPPVYRDEKIADGFGKGPSGVAVLQIDAGRPSLVAWSTERVRLFRGGRTAVADSGLEDLRDVVFIAPGDFDNDGLADLCVVTTRGALLYRNQNGRFRKHAELAAGAFRKAVWIDYDHDYDLDLVLLGENSKLLRNNGSAGFSDESKRFPFAAGRALDAVRFDIEPDTPGFDLVVSYENRRGVLYRDRLGGLYEAVAIEQLPEGARDLAAFDWNHDSRTDLAVGQPELVLLNRAGKLERASGARAAPMGAVADFEGKGRLDRPSISKDGALIVQRDVTPNYGTWLEIALAGVKNLKQAVGSKVEVKAGERYQKLTYEGVPLVVRLGADKQVDTVRITWPNGLIQNETNQAVNRSVVYKEAPRLSGSCPMIFTWSGDRFEFLTDVLGVAPLGASAGDGRYFPVDHDEYVSIPGEKMRPRGGAYEIRITEELHEVSYIDQVRLIALDHPAGVDIVTNEKFKGPPFPEFRLFGVERRIYPAAARDDRGADVRAAVSKRDRVYPDAFRRNAAGVAELHRLDLDFGSAAGANRAVLVLNGWVDWADGSTFLAAMQERKDLVFPYLEVKDGAGNWTTVVEDMGIPAGKPKTIAVDLTGKFLSRSREVRIVTNLCVYWDEIFLIEDSSPPSARLTTVPMISADLHFRGFSRAVIHPERKQPEGFDYQTVSFSSMWNPVRGNYTRYGDVRDLLQEPDDRMAIMGSGDEMALKFATQLPHPPLGWKRDFLLLVDGWAKDADANTAFSQSVLPLPFHAMSGYPYPPSERFPREVTAENNRPALRLIRPLSALRR